uniref:Uncharacterized protein n=1 Tax=Plectus sambesii TaxID=2011161 RepID=A0A914V8R1_9BILA
MSIHRSSNIRRLRRNIGQSFREVGQSIRTEAREKLRRVRKVPRWVRILRKTYHEYGLKHLMLILILAAYQFLGAGIFYFCE